MSNKSMLKLNSIIESLIPDEKVISDTLSWINDERETPVRTFGFEDDEDDGNSIITITVPQDVEINIISKSFCSTRYDVCSAGREYFVIEAGIGKIEDSSNGLLVIEYFFVNFLYNLQGEIISIHSRLKWG